MHFSMRSVLVLAVATAVTVGCDSMPGVLDPPPPGPAELRVRNAGTSRILTSIELRACGSGQLVKWTRVSLSPSEIHTGRYPEGCHNVEIEFKTGGGWIQQVTLSAAAPVQMNPY